MAVSQLTNLYIYLGKRDKSAVKILVIARGKPVAVSRLENPEILNLPSTMNDELIQTIYDNRMLWEPWVESADTFEDLRAALKDRGYGNIPLSSQPQISIRATTPTVNTNQLPKKNAMIRKRN